MAAGRRIIILSQGSAPLLIIQCREISLENMYKLPTIINSARYIYTHICIYPYICIHTFISIYINNKEKEAMNLGVGGTEGFKGG